MKSEIEREREREKRNKNGEIKQKQKIKTGQKLDFATEILKTETDQKWDKYQQRYKHRDQ